MASLGATGSDLMVLRLEMSPVRREGTFGNWGLGCRHVGHLWASGLVHESHRQTSLPKATSLTVVFDEVGADPLPTAQMTEGWPLRVGHYLSVNAWEETSAETIAHR
jgi:hypothetical protein